MRRENHKELPCKKILVEKVQSRKAKEKKNGETLLWLFSTHNLSTALRLLCVLHPLGFILITLTKKLIHFSDFIIFLLTSIVNMRWGFLHKRRNIKDLKNKMSYKLYWWCIELRSIIPLLSIMHWINEFNLTILYIRASLSTKSTFVIMKSIGLEDLGLYLINTSSSTF